MIFFISFDLILIFLIFCIGGISAFFNTLSRDIYLIIGAILVLITLVSTISYTIIQSDTGTKKGFSFWMGLITSVLYFPYFVFMFESISIDRNRYIANFLNTSNLEKLCFYLILFLLLIILVPQVISAFGNPIVNKVFSALPLLLGVIMCFYVSITAIDSYNDYRIEKYKDKSLSANTVVQDVDIYVPSSESGKLLMLYPAFSPIKITNGTIKSGSEVWVVDKDNLGKYYEDYIMVIYKDRVGYIKRDVLSNEVKWGGKD